jgi:hypothetical protein
LIHEQGNIETIEYREKGTYVQAQVPSSVANRLATYCVKQKWPDFVKTKATDDIDWVALGRGKHGATKE